MRMHRPLLKLTPAHHHHRRRRKRRRLGRRRRRRRRSSAEYPRLSSVGPAARAFSARHPRSLRKGPFWAGSAWSRWARFCASGQLRGRERAGRRRSSPFSLSLSLSLSNPAKTFLRLLQASRASPRLSAGPSRAAVKMNVNAWPRAEELFEEERFKFDRLEEKKTRDDDDGEREKRKRSSLIAFPDCPPAAACFFNRKKNR